jgi:hypothetical protein
MSFPNLQVVLIYEDKAEQTNSEIGVSWSLGECENEVRKVECV